MKKVLLILAQSGYQDYEYTATRQGLEEAEFAIKIASEHSGPCTGKLGGQEHADIGLSDVDVSDYDCIAFIGGPGAAAYAEDTEALRIAHEAARDGMPLGAICIAPTILAKARVLGGKRATVWDSGGAQQALLEQYGALYTGDDVTIDGQIVTANGPEAAEEFGRTLGSL